MIRYISYEDAMAAQAVVIVEWSPSLCESEWVKASIKTITHPGEPIETECDITSIAIDESMTRQGMKERAEDIARRAGISNICLHQALASE